MVLLSFILSLTSERSCKRISCHDIVHCLLFRFQVHIYCQKIPVLFSMSISTLSAVSILYFISIIISLLLINYGILNVSVNWCKWIIWVVMWFNNTSRWHLRVMRILSIEWFISILFYFWNTQKIRFSSMSILNAELLTRPIVWLGVINIKTQWLRSLTITKELS